MHLTRFTDLSLRVLMYLTYRNRTSLVTVNELAQKFQWSRNHIVKVAHFLHLQGWIASFRGRSGGLKLAKDPSEYRIGEIVRRLEGGNQPLLDCEHPECTLIDDCQFRHIKEEAYQAFYDKLNEYTLASMTTSPEAQDLTKKPHVVPPSRCVVPQRVAYSSSPVLDVKKRKDPKTEGST